MDRAECITKNFRYAVAGELLMAVLKFVSRRAFIVLLGKEYLGLNGLFNDVLSMLSLAELGFSVSITYSLYRPVAQKDTEMVKSLMCLYCRVYRTVGIVVFLLGLSLTPFLSFLIKEMPKDIPDIPLIYILNLANASISYFFAYKSTLLFVHQKKYIETSIRAVVSLIVTVSQIIILFLTKNYFYYLYLSIVATVAQNIIIAVKVDKLFPYLKEKNVNPLPAKTLKEIRGNVRAMLLHRIGAVAVFNTDNLLISKFIGIAYAGLYSNYIMIRGFLNILINALFDAITPVFGNITATETESNKQTAFCRLNFFSAWLFGWMSICLFCLYDPFINIWLGEGYLLSKAAVFLIVLNFYVNSMRIPVNNTKSVLGLFREDRYKSIFETFFNLMFSVALAKQWGIEGIMAGTLISTLLFPFWCEPFVLCHWGLHISVGKYFMFYLVHISFTAVIGVMTWLLCCTIGEGVVCFLLKGLICVIVPNAVYIFVYQQRDELLFFKEMVKHMMQKII